MHRYLFECMLRSPSFQEELSQFLRKYPVFFRFRKELLRSYGIVEEEVTELWKRFLKENEQRLENIEESDESIVYKYALRNARQSVELEEWEAEVWEFESRLWRAAHEMDVETPSGPILSRVSRNRETRSILSSFEMSADYLALADCKAEHFKSAETQFADNWGVFPHHVRPREKEICVLREDVPSLESDIKLLIPVSDVTTKEELERRWSEVASIQSVFYTKKKRPRRAPFETLLEVYDLRRTLSTGVAAKKLGISPSAVEKHYRRVHRDIHGITPKKALKQQVGLRGRRKTRLGFTTIAATHGVTESVTDTLRAVFIEQNLPLDKLNAPEKLNPNQLELLEEGLHWRQQDRQRKS
jgi:hypothetical protein